MKALQLKKELNFQQDSLNQKNFLIVIDERKTAGEFSCINYKNRLGKWKKI